MNTITEHNINDKVTVTLTQEGLKVLLEDHYRYSPFCKTSSLPSGLKGMEYTTQIWCLMEIFGPKIIMSGPQFFVHNTLKIESEKSTPSPIFTDRTKKITKQSVAIELAREDFMGSLINAIQGAGGSISNLEEMTVKELCESLATNSIRFVYDQKYSYSRIPEERILDRILQKLNNEK